MPRHWHQTTTTAALPPHRPASPTSFLDTPPVAFHAAPRALPFRPQEVRKSLGEQSELARKRYPIERRREKSEPAKKGYQIESGEKKKQKKSLTQLQHYLSTGSLLTILQSNSPFYFHIPDSQFPLLLDPLSTRPYKPLRLDYNPHTSTLRLWMPTPLHNCVSTWAFTMLSDILADLLPRTHRRSLQGSTSDFRLPTSIYTPPHAPDTPYTPPALPTTTSRKRKQPPTCPRKRIRKIAAITKMPDYAYVAHGEKYPRVVFESGWSETEEELRDDAEQWLVKTNGHTRIVITVSLQEEMSPLPARLRELRNNYARMLQDREDEEEPTASYSHTNNNETDGPQTPPAPAPTDPAPGDPPSSPLSSAPSTASDHISAHASLDPTLWVGPITARITLWRYNKSTGRPYRDGPVYILHPDGQVEPKEVPPPEVRLGEICDLGEGEGEGGEKVWRLDWGVLSEVLVGATREYAFRRREDAGRRGWREGGGE